MSLVKIARILARLPATSAMFGPPRRYGSDIALQSSSECRRMAELKPAREFVHGIPEIPDFPVLAEQIHGGFAVRSEPAQNLYALPGARVVGGCYGNGIITNRDRFLLDQYEDFGQPIDGHPIHLVTKLPAIERMPGTTLSLLSRWADNYWHWLFDVVGKLLLLQSQGRCHLPSSFRIMVSQAQSPPFKMQSIEALGIEPDSLIDVKAYSHFWFENLLVADRHCGNPYPELDVIDALRNAFLKPLRPDDQGDRIYVSRGKASSRRISNELDLESVLLRFGFRKVYLEDMKFMDQVRLFQNTSAVFSQHGAGLTNLVFARTGIPVFELFEPEFVNPCYAFLAYKLGLRYRMLFSSSKGMPTASFHWSDIPETVFVDVRAVNAVLERALGAVR